MSDRMYHPCHKLSVPSAKIYWCRHCMQMFEDAISRWHHSRECRANPGVGVPGTRPARDRDSRVVQLYIPPDQISYTTNIKPGQKPYHKPLHKKIATDLQCIICKARFLTIEEMRVHVKDLCSKNQNQSANTSDSKPALKIRRVKVNTIKETSEGIKDHIQTSTALSVLAAASRHVELLAYSKGLQGQEVILPYPLEGQPAPEDKITPSAVRLEPVCTGTENQSAQLPVIIVPAQDNTNLSPYFQGIAAQTEDSEPQEDSKDPDTIIVVEQDRRTAGLTPVDADLTSGFEVIQQYIQQSAISLPQGHIIQVQAGDKIQRFKVLESHGVGQVIPVDDDLLPANIDDSSLVQKASKEEQEEIDRLLTPETHLHLPSQLLALNTEEEEQEDYITIENVSC